MPPVSKGLYRGGLSDVLIRRPALPRMAALGVVLSLLSACGEGSPSAEVCPEGQMVCDGRCVPRVTPDVASIHREIILRGCAGSNSCHAGPSPKERLDLSTEESMAALVGAASLQRPDVNLIEPLHPELSYFIHKLVGENMSEQSGTRGSSRQMPKGAPPLCPEKIEVIQQWILDGAQ